MKKRAQGNGGKIFQWWFVAVLFGYVLASIAYQVLYPYFSYWPTLLTNEITLNSCYSMRMRIPLSTPILYANQGDQAKQVTLWVWQSNSACEGEAEISFSSPEDIVWLDQKRDEVAPSLQVQTGKTETAAPHYSFYIYTPVLPNPSAQISLKIYINDQPANDILLRRQSQFEALFFGFLYIFLGTPSLTMVAGALATGFGIFQTYKNLETMRLQRQRELEADIEKLKQISGRAAADIGLQYSSLMDRIEKWGFGEDKVILSTAQRVFKIKQDEYVRARIWAFTFRKEIASRLKEPGFKDWLEKADNEIQFLNKDEVSILRQFPAKDISSFTELLALGLKAFSILGVDNVTELCKVIASAIPGVVNESDEGEVKEALEQVKEKWFTQGSSGRYLCGELVKVKDGKSKFIPALHSKVFEWENKENYPPNLLGRNASLWAAEPLYSLTRETETYLKQFATFIKWRTPFGPTKAEFDPRLPRQIIANDKRPVKGFFCEEHPIWEKVIGAHSLCVTAEHGMGSTALILMGRHVRRFWGRMPSLSMFLQLHGKSDEGVLWQMVEQALFEQVVRDLVEDPFWLLNAPTSSQQLIASFLIQQAGGFNSLLLKIEEAGLPDTEREVVGLALFDVSDLPAYQSHLQFTNLVNSITNAMLIAAYPRMKDDQFHVFLWVECKNSDALDGWLDLIEHTGLKSLAILKLFVPSPLYSMKIRHSLPVENLHWERDQLKEMLLKRIKQAQLPIEDFPLEQLLDTANGSPACLIETGNKLKFPGN